MSDMEEKRQKLFSACESGDKSALLQLVKSEGVNPSAYDMINDKGKTALHIACHHGCIDIVRMLVEIYGCSLSSVDNTGSIPFHDACFCDQVEIVDYLIHVANKPSDLLLAVDIKGNTAFHKANQSGSTQVVEYILYIIFTGTTPQKLCVDRLFMTPTFIGHDDSDGAFSRHYFFIENLIGDNAVAVACRHGQVAIIRTYIHYYTHFLCDIFKNLQYLLSIASQCGHFELAYYLQKTCISSNNLKLPLSSHFTRKQWIEQEMYTHYNNEYDKEIHISVQKRWCIMNSPFDHLVISEIPFRVAILHDNPEYVQKFLMLQGNCFHNSTEFNLCHAACISDNIQMLDRSFDDEIVKFGNTPLHTACEWGSENAVKYLITNKKCNINVCNNLGETPLHLACRHRRTEIVKILLKNDCRIDIKTSRSKESPLHLACLHTNSNIASLILDKQIDHSDIDIPDGCGDTPLINACRNKNIFLVKCLVDKGCNPIYANEYTMETPVHIACRMQRLDILQILVQNFDNTSKLDIRNNFGETPLCIALINDYMDIIDFLVCKKLCDVSLMLQGSSLFNQSYEPTGDTALHYACERNDLKLVQLLLKHSPVNVINGIGNTPFHVAAKNGTASSLIMKCLVDKYGDSLDPFINVDGDSVLHVACEQNSFEMVKLLLNHCSVTLKNHCGNTPIHVACHKQSIKVVNYLLEKCSGNLDCYKNNNNNTFLHVASKGGNLEIVKLLLKHCSATCQNVNGNTPIHIACSTNQLSIVECLLHSIESTYPFVNKKGQTYLHAVCNDNAQLDMVKLIFEKGYKILGNYQDNNGDTPLHYICRLNKKEIAEYLLTDERCDPYRQNNQGLSPFYSIIQLRGFEFFKELLCKKLCDPNQLLKKGSPLLHCLLELSNSNHQLRYRRRYQQLITCDEFDYVVQHYEPNYYGTVDMFVFLLKNCTVDFNATNSDGNTALHLACQFERYDVVQFLLSIESDIVRQSVSHQNHAGKTPIQLTSDYRIIRSLISYGANPENVYERFAAILQRSKEEQPLEPTVKVIVLGNSTAGKTTLVEALKSSEVDVMQVEGSTAGIVTCEHNSDDFGRVTFHDFAGQPEYESSHCAFLESCSSSVQPPLFLLVVDASQYQYIEKRIHNWLSFIQNHCTYSTETPPHVIVIGSHIDQVEDIQMSHTSDIYIKAIENFKSSVFKCFQPVFLDCRKVGTKEMKTLRLRLKDSCLSLKKFVELDCRCHILFANLAKWFPTSSVIKVTDLQRRIRQRKSTASNYPTKRIRSHLILDAYIQDCYSEDISEDLLPTSTDPLLDLLKSLHTGGHILLLEGEADSWIVMNQDALFKTVNGILFAPKDFKQHMELDNNTGIVPLSKLSNLFPDLDFNMVKQFLVHYEFCHQIEDNETLKLIHGRNDLLQNKVSVYYFFPGFIKSEKPSTLWDLPQDSESPYGFSSGWMLQCQLKQFFDTRFLHVLLLRLTFTFVASSSEASVLRKKCDIWKNGIHWGTRNGVEVLVELIEEKTVVLVLVRCFKGQELEAVKLRTAVLKKIWEAKLDFCPKVEANEYLIRPSEMQTISSQTFKSHKISITEIAQTIIEGSPFVICPSNNKPLPLDTLLYYEPYSRMDEDHLKMFFTKENANISISPDTLFNLSNFLHPVYQHLVKVLKIPPTELGYHIEKWRDHPVQLLHHLLESWTSRRGKPTFGTLRSEFDQYSIFFGRNPLELRKSTVISESTEETLRCSETL